jgi:hypothetical protein
VPAAERLFILLGLNSEGEFFAPRFCMFKEWIIWKLVLYFPSLKKPPLLQRWTGLGA